MIDLSLVWPVLSHPLGYCPGPRSVEIACKGYNWHSGLESNLGEYVIVGGIITHFRHKNCHHKGCWRIHTHQHPEYGWPACKDHWNEKPAHVS